MMGCAVIEATTEEAATTAVVEYEAAKEAVAVAVWLVPVKGRDNEGDDDDNACCSWKDGCCCCCSGDDEEREEAV